MIIKTDQIKSEYISSVYQMENNMLTATPSYIYWKFPLPKVLLKDNTGLAENEAIMISPYKVEVIDGNVDFDISVEGDYVVVRPKPAVLEYCYVGVPSLDFSNHPLKFIKYYFVLNGSEVVKTCAELVSDEENCIWLNFVADGFIID